MSRSLHVLMVEDSELDMNLVLRQLKRLGYDTLNYARVDSAKGLQEVMQSSSNRWDIVLSDFNMPNFNGMQALEIVRKFDADLPFIVVSGAIGEETAVELMKAGVDDYIPKTNLEKLCPAVTRTLREAASRTREREARIAAEKAFHDREKMLSVVSHDLKNPLNAISLNVGLLNRLLQDPKRPNRDEQMKIQFGRIQRSVERMNHLINDVLDVAKIEAGRFMVQKSENRIDELVSELVDFFEPIAMQKAIIISAEIPQQSETLMCDRDKMFQAISNLLGNAIKFTPNHGKVNVMVRSEVRQTLVAVKDSGPGIEKEHLPYIFNRFWQAKLSGGTGSGLGLSIVKGIVEAHGGKIWVESEIGKGTTVFLTLPHE